MDRMRESGGPEHVGEGRCFARDGEVCRVLTEMCCERCRFYKTGRQLEEERRCCARRLDGKGLRSWAALKYGGFGGGL